jgi:hypothetical protein
MFELKWDAIYHYLLYYLVPNSTRAMQKKFINNNTVLCFDSNFYNSNYECNAIIVLRSRFASRNYIVV